jgi:hypothetical protein
LGPRGLRRHRETQRMPDRLREKRHRKVKDSWKVETGDCKFKISLEYITRPYFKQTNQQRRQTGWRDSYAMLVGR